jgi:hypothetical protein
MAALLIVAALLLAPLQLENVTTLEACRYTVRNTEGRHPFYEMFTLLKATPGTAQLFKRYRISLYSGIVPNLKNPEDASTTYRVLEFESVMGFGKYADTRQLCDTYRDWVVAEFVNLNNPEVDAVLAAYVETLEVGGRKIWPRENQK